MTSPLDPWARWRIVVTEAGSAPLCVALANTRERRDARNPVERLDSVEDFLRFASAHGLCDEATAQELAARAAAHPRAARAELAATLKLREAIARVLPRFGAADEADLRILADAFDEAQRALVVELRGDKLAARPRTLSALRVVRLQAAVSAVALLTSPDARRVRRCADDRGCGRLFLDTTRNGSRRFCLAAECGNRARQAAFRARKRGGAATGDR